MRRSSIIAVTLGAVLLGGPAATSGVERTPMLRTAEARHHHRHHHRRRHRHREATAVASVYAAAGGPLGCGGTAGASELIVAHKTLPCGTRVRFCYPSVWTRREGQRCIVATVRDRGPYVAGRTWDLAMATARALDFPVGVESVGYRLLR